MKRIFKIVMCVLVFLGCKQSTIKNAKSENEISTQKDTREWVDIMIEGYRGFNKNRSIKSADQIFEATELMPNKNLENYLVSAMVYAPKGEKEKAFLSIESAINNGFKSSEILNSISEYSSLLNDNRWDSLLIKIKNKQTEYEKTIQNPELLEMLKYLWSKDQEVLEQYENKIKSLDSTATSEDYRILFIPVKKRWEINRIKLDSIIDIYGWPGNKLVGDEGAKIAWGIPQHHPDIFFKKKCQTLIKESVKKGDVDPLHYAQLTDRIARETWQKQEYGTSMRENSPYPIKDPIYVNKKRFDLGLIEPIEIYAIYHGFEYTLPSEQEIHSSYEKAQSHYKEFENFIGLKKLDSANTYIVKAISYHGDINNEQLYNASIKLAQFNNIRSNSNSLKILKVLIWRKWDKRFQILKDDRFDLIRNQNEWKEIKRLIKMSN